MCPRLVFGSGLTRKLVVDGGHLAGDHGGALVEVEVRPLQAQALSSSAPSGGHEHPCREVTVLSDEVQEPAELVRCPGVGPAAANRADRRRIGGIGDVACQAAPPHCVLQSGVDDRVDVAHGPRLQACRRLLLRSSRRGLAPREGGDGVASEAATRRELHRYGICHLLPGPAFSPKLRYPAATRRTSSGGCWRSGGVGGRRPLSSSRRYRSLRSIGVRFCSGMPPM